LVQSIDFTQEPVEIVIFNAHLPPTDHIYITEIERDYSGLISEGKIKIYHTNANLYPDMSNLPKNYGDSAERVYWRSKTCLDYCMLYKLCEGQSDYFIHLEDDVVAQTGFYTFLRDDLSNRPEKQIIRLNQLGAVAVLYHQSILDKMVTYINSRYWEKPIDWLIDDYVKINPGIYELLPECYFQHIGYESSLMENNQVHSRPLNDTRFNIPTEYLYFRELPTGLGDRIGVYMCVAAFAQALHSKVHVFWCCKQPQGMNLPLGDWCSDFTTIQKFIHFPECLVFHEKQVLEKIGHTFTKLDWTAGELPAKLAYDCLPTLAYRTIDVQIPEKKYREAYRTVAQEFAIIDPTGDSEKYIGEGSYGVIHVRGGDKANWTSEFVHSTQNIIQQIPETKWVVITDDPITFEKFPHFREYIVMPVSPGLAGTLRDFSILTNARVIVQHCELGWSAYSHIASLLRETPIINTYPNLHNNSAQGFVKLKGMPDNFYNYTEIDKLLGDLQ